MITGLNQEVTVLGRTFHFQTELHRRGDLFVRTEVFVGGKVVATREHRLVGSGQARLDEDLVRELMKKQHQRVIESTQQRAEAYQEKRQSPAADTPSPAAQPPADPPGFDLRQAESLTPPSDAKKTEVGSAIRIRRIFGKFRLRLGLTADLPEEQLTRRLETAARGFSWIVSSPTFQEIRLDEQMRCHLVNEQVGEWLKGDRNSAKAREIWSEIVTFNDYVAEINNRAELIAFDRQLLMWGAYQVQSRGLSDQLLDHLQWLSGRDLELDRLLDQPAEVAADAWFQTLCRVLTRTPGE